jgi:DUF4097 and DUF4098 domain-containing protein YvlB
MTPWIRTAFVAFFLTALPSVAIPSAAQTVERQFHETFAVQEGMSLRLRNGDGDVTIRPWDRDELEVDVYYRAEPGFLGFGRPANFTVDFAQTDDRIVVTSREPGQDTGFFDARVEEYTYTIQAPAYLVLELRGDDGDVDIRNWNAPLDIGIDDGDLTIEGISTNRITIRKEDGDLFGRGIEGELFVTSDDGDVVITDALMTRATIRMEDGDLEMSDSEGSLDVVTDDGSIRLQSLVSDDLDIRTEDGDIWIALVGGNPPDVDLESDDGSIELGVGPGVSAEFSINTEDGDVRVDLPEADGVEIGESRATGSLRGGTGSIRMRSADGRVVLREIP